MHSSRMRTGRSLTVCRGGGLPARGGTPCPRGGGTHPPVNRITHSCKNITLATTSLRPVITLWITTAITKFSNRSATLKQNEWMIRRPYFTANIEVSNTKLIIPVVLMIMFISCNILFVFLKQLSQKYKY